MTPTATSTQTEKGTWPLGLLLIIRPAPHPWPFVEGRNPTISFDKQYKSDVTNIHGRANEDDVPIHGTVLMASESPRAEQKPHDDDNQVTVMIDIGSRAFVYINNPTNMAHVQGRDGVRF